MNNTALGIGLAGLLASIVKGAAKNSEEDRVRQAFGEWSQRFKPESRSMQVDAQGADGAPSVPMTMNFRNQPQPVDDGALADLYAQIGGEASAAPFIRAGESMYRQTQIDDAKRAAADAKRAEMEAKAGRDAQEQAGRTAQEQYNLMMQRMDLTPEGEKYMGQLPEQVNRGKFTGSVKDEAGQEYPAFKSRPRDQKLDNAQWVSENGKMVLLGIDPVTGEQVKRGYDTQNATKPPTYRDQNAVKRGGRGVSNKSEKETAKMHAARAQYGAAIKALQNAEQNKVLTKSGVGYKAVMPRGLKNIETTNPQDIKDAIKYYQQEYDGITNALRDRGAVNDGAGQQPSAGKTSRVPNKYR
jgi:hypothetical protein